MSKKIGLALGGGGTKGFMHIGVLRYLEDHNYVIEEVSGASSGAMIGSLIASQKTSQEIYDIAKSFTIRDMFDINMRDFSIKGTKIISRIMRHVDVDCIEDLPIPFTVVGMDLRIGREVAFSEGGIADALLCSSRVPGVFSVPFDDPIVDGGVVNNLPVNYLNTEHIVAVSCAEGHEDYVVPRGKKIGCMNVLLPFVKRKSISSRSFAMMFRRMEDLLLMQYPQAKLIRPYTGDFGIFDISILDEAVERGYQEAKKILGD